MVAEPGAGTRETLGKRQTTVEIDKVSHPSASARPAADLRMEETREQKGWLSRFLCCFAPRPSREGYKGWDDPARAPAAEQGSDAAGPSKGDAGPGPRPIEPPTPLRAEVDVNSPRKGGPPKRSEGEDECAASNDLDTSPIYSVDAAAQGQASGWIPRGMPLPKEGAWEGYPNAVLGPPDAQDASKKTLVLDLDETLVHSSFKPVPNPDFVIPVEIDGRELNVYVLKRPHLDEFMASIADRFEVVVFTASLSKYADPLLDLLDVKGVIRWRLFREACQPFQGNYVKNLLCLGRDMSNTIIVDNSPHSYIFQPENALPVSTFIDDDSDEDLLRLLHFLDRLATCEDVRDTLAEMGVEPFPDDF